MKQPPTSPTSQTMGSCLPSLDRKRRLKDSLPIETAFKLPSALPPWPRGGGFAKGTIDLGGLEVCQVTSFTKVWTALDGGPDNAGATFFNPSAVPNGFSLLGCYAQPNNKPLFGWVLAGRDLAGGTLRPPVDYALVWNSANSKVRRDGDGYFWLPMAPEGYEAVGLLVTASPEKPSPAATRCVRADLTDASEKDGLVWSDGKGFEVYGLRPSATGSKAAGVAVGTCMAGPSASPCLKNKALLSSAMPDRNQIEALVQAYSPWFFFHPDESYLPSSVPWFFSNGALLYKKDDPTPTRVDPTGSNLPQGGFSDGEYWLDLPADGAAMEKVKRGDLSSSETYLHVKPMLGGTFTDLAFWLFFPFNGPARAKVLFFNNVSLGKIGEHVGDWEHVTLRISNFFGELRQVFLAQHGGGEWMDASQLEFRDGMNKPVAYSSLHGHASYPKPGLMLQGNSRVGVRNDASGGGPSLDTGERWSLVAADHLATVAEPLWLNYMRKWGPKVTYNVASEVKRVVRVLPWWLRAAAEREIRRLPGEIFEEDGPTGPKEKSNWAGDEG